MQRKSRYVKPNILDWLLLAVLILFALALLLRGTFSVLSAREIDCHARVEFVIRELDEDAVHLLSEAHAPFYLADGSLLTDSFTTAISRTTELVRDEQGNLFETESLATYKVTVAFTATGRQAKDGTFLFGGTRRLAMGETLFLTQGDISYTADVVQVSVYGG